MPSSCVPSLPPHPIESKHFSDLFQLSSVTDANYEPWVVCQQQEFQKPTKEGERCSAGLGRGQGVEQRAWWQGLDDRDVSSLSYLPDCLCCWTSGVTLPKTFRKHDPFGEMVVVGLSASLSQAGCPLLTGGRALNCTLLCSHRKSLHLRHPFPRQNANSAAGTCCIFQD